MPGKDKEKKGGLGSRLHSVIKRVIKDKQVKAKEEEVTAAKAEKRQSVSKKEAREETKGERARDECKVEKGEERKDEKKVKQEKVREQREV